MKRTYTWDAGKGCLVEKVKPRRTIAPEVDVYQGFVHDGKAIRTRADERDLEETEGIIRETKGEMDTALIALGNRANDPSIPREELVAESQEIAGKMKEQRKQFKQPILIDEKDESFTRDNMDRIAAESRKMSEGLVESPGGASVRLDRESGDVVIEHEDGEQERVQFSRERIEQMTAPASRERISWSGGR